MWLAATSTSLAEPLLHIEADSGWLAIERVESVAEQIEEAVLYIQLTPEDASRFGAFTEKHVGTIMKLSVCGTVYSEPRLMTTIYGGTLQISELSRAQSMTILEQLRSGICSKI